MPIPHLMGSLILNESFAADTVILNSRCEPTILRNESPAPGHWIQLRLRGTTANRDTVGAQIRVTAGGRTWLDEVHRGRGYQSHYGLRLHVGLGASNRVDRLEIRWLGGGVTVLENVRADRGLTIVEVSPYSSRQRGTGVNSKR